MKYVPFLFLVLFAGNLALGSLGDNADSIEIDKKAISAFSDKSTNQDLYTIREIKSEGVLVREYISKAGNIFGVTWKGNFQPDLQPLLGRYFKDYSASIKKPTKRRLRGSRVVTKGTSVVVEKYGHMRSLSGRAYVPALLPLGVDPNEIK